MPALNRSHKKVLRTPITKQLHNFNDLRKITGRLILTNFPNKSRQKMTVLLLNPLQGLRQTDKHEILILQQY